jgi:hypothetical protein
MLATTAEHRALNRRAQTAITWAGTLSALSILAVLVDTIGRSIFS